MKRYQKQDKPKIPSRRKLADELAKTEKAREWTSRQLDIATKEQSSWMTKACRLDRENQRMAKQIEGLTSFRDFVHVAASPGFSSREDFIRHQTVEMGMYHVGVDIRVDSFRRHECDKMYLIEAIADQIAQEARSIVMKNLRVV